MNYKIIDLKGTYIDLSFKSKKELYHYTSPGGLLGILNTNGISLRFTRYDCVNDLSEGKDVRDCYKRVCNELYSSFEIDEDFFKLVINIEPYEMWRFYFQSGEKVIGIDSKFYAYICCFSVDPDSLPMWNYYVKNGNYQGYNIGFKCDLFHQYFDDLQYGKGYDFQINKVVYDDRIKKEIIAKLLKALYRIKDQDARFIRFFISYNLTQWHLSFKSKYFIHEKEVRAILLLPQTIPNNFSDERNFKTEYRESKGYIIPYIEILFNNKTCTKMVTIGPLAERDISRSAVQNLLAQRGYKDVLIKHSDIPIRY